MNDDDWKMNAAFVLTMMAAGFLGGFLGGFICGHEVDMSQFKQEAVDKGHAEYDRKTTEFKWLSSSDSTHTPEKEIPE